MKTTSPTEVSTAAKRVVLKPRKVRPFFGRHPWVLDSAVGRVEGEPADGDVVDLVSDRGQFIARGTFNSQSRLRVRLYTWQADEALDTAFWQKRLLTAISLRKTLGYDRPEGAARLVSSEADGLSGLIVERYGSHIVMQETALGMIQRLDELLPTIVQECRPQSVAVRVDKQMVRAEGITFDDAIVHGQRDDGPVFIEEHGIRYGVDLDAGQKTGFFLDQRENRKTAAAYAAGRRVLDVCCYTGAFSLAALKLGGARETLGIDSSPKAIALAQANSQLNGIANARFEVGDAFQRLEFLAESGERFGMVVLDPPKFARNRDGVQQALRAYHHLNRLAVMALEPGGILVTCSCSGHVTREDFAFMLADVAQRTGREIQFLEMRGAAPDHPVIATCLESEYLKCFVCRVV
jgi:23S rRNA (cytosine1962-C5)-methyltransferase